MKPLNVKKLGLAAGLTGAIVYIGCFLTMLVLSKDLLIKSGNLLFHGVDFTQIIRMDISILETLLGIVISFIFWGLIGVVLGSIYNKLS